MNQKKKEDLQMGLHSEENLLFRIRELYGQDIERTGLYDIFDYENENFMIELKTRRIKSTDYDDIMISLYKLQIAEITENKTSIFLWKMKDGLFMWRFNKKQFSIRMGGTCRRGKDERKYVGYVLTKFLTKV